MIIGNGIFLRTTKNIPPPPVGDGSIPTLVASGSTFGSSATALTLGGGTYQAYDVGIAIVHSNFSDFVVPTGWTFINSITTTATFNVTMSMFWRRALSTTDLENTVFNDVGNQGGQILVFRGVKASGSPIDVSNFTRDDTNNATVTIAGVTTTNTNRLIVTAFAEGVDSAVAPISAGLTNAGLSGVTNVINTGYTAANGGNIGAAIGGKAVAGATGNTTGTSVNTVTHCYATIALLPNP